jgi:MFS family permease
VGAAGSSLAFRIGGTTRLHLLVAASILGLLTFVSRDVLVQPRNLHEEEKLRFPDASLLGLAILAFFALFCEGAIGDWSAVYLHFHLKLSSAVSAAGFAAYAVFMAISRFTGDWAGRNLSRSTVLSASGAAVSIGFLLTLSAPNAWFALGGLALTGLGTANVIPIVLQLASKSSSMSAGPAISAVSTLGYFGFLAGPPLIGWLATGIGLPLALGLVVASGVVIALGPLFLRGVLVSAAPENEYIEAATK